jgi:hypothetical protein
MGAHSLPVTQRPAGVSVRHALHNTVCEYDWWRKSTVGRTVLVQTSSLYIRVLIRSASEVNVAEFAPDKVPIEDLVAVRGYITDDFAMIDSALRLLDRDKLEELDPYIRLATYGLFQLPSYRGVVYRGTMLSEATAACYVPGTVVFEHAFVSATADPARRFPGNTTFVIASINGRDVSLVATNPEERDVVFFTGTRFKVLAVEQDGAQSHRVIYLAEIPDKRLFQGP